MALQAIAITTGEPAGIGPDISIMLSQTPHAVPLVFLADPELMSQRAEQLGLSIKLNILQPNQAAEPTPAGVLNLLPIPLQDTCIAGELNTANATYVLNMLNEAIRGCLARDFSSMVTAPVHKAVINDAGVSFSGHTEFLAAATNTSRVVMMLATEHMRVALATTHLPLAQVPTAITRELLIEVVGILYSELKAKFGIAQPRILICGLNPHAGENGHLGREEIEVIEPALESLRASGMKLIGPLPADTLFASNRLQNADAVLAMFHDQGLPVIKYAGFGQAVNITLGLPIIRTSVDHGTALDLAGTGHADPRSLQVAIDYAANLVISQQN